MVTATLRPVANGEYQQCYQQEPSSGEHWDKVCDQTTATYVRSYRTGGTTLYETYKFNFPPGVYSQIKLTLYAKDLYGTYGHYSNIGGYVYKSGVGGHAESLEALYDTKWTYYTYTYNQNPITDTAWGMLSGDAVEFGFKGWQCCNNESILLAEVVLEVTYTPIAAGSGQIIGLSAW